MGLGYVGLTGASCLLRQGHEVVGVEPNTVKLAQLERGASPIAEPEIEEWLGQGLRAGRWAVFADATAAKITECEIIFVSVGTPGKPDGSHDMSHIEAVSIDLAQALRQRTMLDRLTLVYRSTMLPGSMAGLVQPTFAKILGTNFNEKLELVYNPEFTREGSAVNDFLNPSRIVVGTADGRPSQRLAELNRHMPAPTFTMAFGEAEFIKLVDNAWHATKVAFANEFGRCCARMGIDFGKAA